MARTRGSAVGKRRGVSRREEAAASGEQVWLDDDEGENDGSMRAGGFGDGEAGFVDNGEN